MQWLLWEPPLTQFVAVVASCVTEYPLGQRGQLSWLHHLRTSCPLTTYSLGWIEWNTEDDLTLWKHCSAIAKTLGLPTLFWSQI